MAITKVVLTANGNVKLTDASDNIQHILPAGMKISVDPRDANGLRISEDANPENEDTAIRFRWNDLTVPAGLTDRDDCLVQLERDFFKGAAANVSTNSTTTKVAYSNTSATLIAANPNRKGLEMFNSTDAKAYILQGSGTAVVEDDILLDIDKSRVVATTEAITFISATATAGNIIVIEYL